ncbi:release factor H-coupled R [Exidia glandulosa HHB12029]|uniref:3'-phosphate/5'-hydroxy nucleic acid ligase n=1 Tax=Exidia glandulosa HHB12029 TaxID=1314781 RepID=A0A165HU13_EXIGL|nr:release factor H-coupled R [Exidia glandulosa HHB12029]
MGSRALTLTLNANHSKKSTIIVPLDADDVHARILREARNKFRSKALSRVYLLGGIELNVEDDLPFGTTQVWVSKGEDYTGPPAPGPSRLDAAPAVRVMARQSYIDALAVKQLEAVAALPDIREVVGMPDLHPGSRFPIGCAIAADGVYPALVGSDIGCGIALYFLAARRKATPARLAARLVGLDAPWTGDRRAWLARYDLEGDDEDLGTVGAGNHFAELCDVEAVLHPVPAHPLLNDGALCLLVHSGSRGRGAAILAEQTSKGASNPYLSPGSPELDAYLAKHDAAVRWGRANRDLIAHRVRACLFSDDDQEEQAPDLQKLADVSHNAVERRASDNLYVHRKGAAPSLPSPALIPCPGSRGTFSYLLAATGTSPSLAHGAGRRHPRANMHEGASSVPTRTTALGSEVVCEDRVLMLEERPEAYKDIETVVRDMEELGMARAMVKLRPVVSYKIREGAGAK